MGKAVSKPAVVNDTTQASQVSDATLHGLVGYQVKRASDMVLANLKQTLRPFDLRMLTHTALVLIVDNPGLRQSQLADAMDIERPNLVVIIDELERRALINRDRVPTDRRAYALNPTLAGRRLYDKAVEAVKTHDARLLQGVDEPTRAIVMEAMQQIRKNAGRREKT